MLSKQLPSASRALLFDGHTVGPLASLIRKDYVLIRILYLIKCPTFDTWRIRKP